MAAGDATADYFRYCSGEEHILISDAICRGRRRTSFPKCPGCQFNDDERDGSAAAAPAPIAISARPRRAADIDAVFKAYDVRGIVPDPLSESLAWRVGHASAQFLRARLSGFDRADPLARSLVVGRDMRTHSPAIQGALMDGIRASGVDVIDIGLIDTPQLYFAVNHFGTCGGIQTTASHNPAEYNGFKICGAKGTPIGAETGLSSIREIAGRVPVHDTGTQAKRSRNDLAAEYREFVLGFLRGEGRLGRRLKVVVDAGNGMAGRWFPIVFDGLKGLTVVPLNFEHDGTFVHDPNPLVPANLRQLRKAVKERKADFGACFDGDADRCIFVDERAAILGCDLITALLARSFLERDKGAAVVYDLRSSRVVPETILAAGGVPVRERVGHSFMKRTMAERDAVFGGELSGHFYFRDNYYCDSGLIAFVSLLNLLTDSDRKLGEHLRSVQKYRSSGEMNFECADKDAAIGAIREEFPDAEIDDLDGVTVQYPDWWFNVRKSNTEPLLRLNLEARTKKIVDQKIAMIAPLLGKRVAH